MFTLISFVTLFLALIWNSIATAATLRLAWRDTSSVESGFKIERLSGAEYVEIARVGANVQSYSDTTVTSGKNYCYRVKAYNSAGTSAPTNAACATVTSGASSSGGSSGGNSGGAPTMPPPSPTPGPVTSPSSGDAWKDYEIQLTMRSTDNDALGVLFRYQDQNNFYRFSWAAEDKERRLEKRVNGRLYVLARDTVAYTVGRNHVVRISARGPSITLAIDGKNVFSVNDTSIAQGTVGLYSYRNSGSYFDDIHVQDLKTGATLAMEDFSKRSHDAWTVIDKGDTGTVSKWSASQAVLGQTSNIGSENDPHKLGTYALYSGGGWKDYRVTFKMKSSDNDRLGVLFRFRDSNNHYRFIWSTQEAGRRLLKKVNGKFQVLAQDAQPYVSNRTYAVEIVAQGNSLKLNIDGKSVFNVTDATFNTGSVALYSSSNQNSQFDDILVEDLKSKKPLLDEDFSDGELSGWNAFDEPGTTEGPSKWRVAGGMLTQSSNIGGDTTGFPGTLLIYDSLSSLD